MKTIEQAATERSIYYESNSYCDFKAGVEFAQQLISVEDELPPAKKQVIAKLISEHGKEYETMAIYIPPRTILAEDFMMDDDMMIFMTTMKKKILITPLKDGGNGKQ